MTTLSRQQLGHEANKSRPTQHITLSPSTRLNSSFPTTKVICSFSNSALKMADPRQLMDIVSAKLLLRSQLPRSKVVKSIFHFRTLPEYLRLVTMMWIVFTALTMTVIYGIIINLVPTLQSALWWRDVANMMITFSFGLLMYIRIYYFFRPRDFGNFNDVNLHKS